MSKVPDQETSFDACFMSVQDMVPNLWVLSLCSVSRLFCSIIQLCIPTNVLYFPLARLSDYYKWTRVSIMYDHQRLVTRRWRTVVNYWKLSELKFTRGEEWFRLGLLPIGPADIFVFNAIFMISCSVLIHRSATKTWKPHI